MNPKSIGGIAAIISVIITIPSVIVNTYFDYHERKNQLLLQKSTYANTITAFEELNNEVATMRSELAELRGYVNATKDMHMLAGRRPRPTAADKPDEIKEDEAVEKIDLTQPRKMPSFNDIQQHVQTTGSPLLEP